MRALDHLEATVGLVRAVDGNHATGHIRIETRIELVPIAVILVPLPRPADERLLQHHLVMEMIDLIPQQRLHRIHHPVAADTGAVNVVVQFIPQPQPAHPALGILRRMRLVHIPVGLGDVDQEIGLFLVEEPRDQEITGIIELRDLRGSNCK